MIHLNMSWRFSKAKASHNSDEYMTLRQEAGAGVEVGIAAVNLNTSRVSVARVFPSLILKSGRLNTGEICNPDLTVFGSDGLTVPQIADSASQHLFEEQVHDLICIQPTRKSCITAIFTAPSLFSFPRPPCHHASVPGTVQKQRPEAQSLADSFKYSKTNSNFDAREL